MQTALNTVMEQAAVATQPRRLSVAELDERLAAFDVEIADVERQIANHEEQRREAMARNFLTPSDEAKRAERHHVGRAAELRQKLEALRLGKEQGMHLKVAAAEAERLEKLRASIPLARRRIEAARRVDTALSALAAAYDDYETVVKEMVPVGRIAPEVLPGIAFNVGVRMKLATRAGLPRRLVGILAEAPNLAPTPSRSLEQSDRDLLARLLKLEIT